MPTERRRKSPTPAPQGLVDHYRKQVWLHHLLQAVSAVHLGQVPSLLEGNAEEGRYWHANGGGDHIAIAWGPAGLVAMAFDHESYDSEATVDFELRTPERVFERAPKSLAGLVRQVSSWPPADRLGSAAHWIAVDADGREKSGSSLSESEQLKGYVVSAADALNGESPGLAWREMAGVSESQAQLAEKLSKTPGATGRVVTEAEERVLLSPPPDHRGGVPTPENVATAVALFAQAGISWPTGVASAAALAGDGKVAGGDVGDAVASGQVDDVREPPQRGARADGAARPGQVAGEMSGGEPVELAREPGRPDETVREPAEGARPRSELGVSFTRTIRRFARLQHIIFAMRSMHTDLVGFSQFAGTHEEGRHGYSAEDASHHVIAWSEPGMVGWVIAPGSHAQAGGSAGGPAAPGEAFADAPAELRSVIESAETWIHAPKGATEAFWIHPGSKDPDGVMGSWGAGTRHFARHIQHFSNPNDPRTNGWPKEALLVHKDLAALASRMSKGCIAGHCDEPRESEVALILKAPRGRGATSRERVQASAELLAQLGMNWAEALRGGMP